MLANVSQLYIAPGVLSLVEQHAPLQTLLGTILFFTLALLLTLGGKAYLEEVRTFCLVEMRDSIVQKICKNPSPPPIPIPCGQIFRSC